MFNRLPLLALMLRSAEWGVISPQGNFGKPQRGVLTLGLCQTPPDALLVHRGGACMNVGTPTSCARSRAAMMAPMCLVAIGAR
jgi:hypothetical protein